MADLMRVLFATTHIHFPQGGGGLERNTHELCLALRARGINPGVMSSLRAEQNLLSYANRVKRVLLRQEYPCDTDAGYPVFRGWADDGAAEVVDRFRPDLVVVQRPQPTAMVHAFRRRGVPAAVYVHEVEDIDDLGPLGAEGIRFVANSRFTANRLLERCGVKSFIVRPLIDPRDYAVSSRPERALFVNTVPRKGLDVVMRLAESRPDVTFDLVLSWILDARQRDALRLWCKSLGNVFLHPPTRDMRPLYKRARVLLAPSQWEEAWGRVATEAQVNGIPVLASDRGGLPEAVGPGGILLPADASQAEWLAAFAQLWDDRGSYERFSRAALEHARRDEIQPAAIVDEVQRILPILMQAA